MYRVSKIDGKYVPEVHSEILGWLYMQLSSHDGELQFWKSSKYLNFCLLNTEEEANRVIDIHIKHVLNSIKMYATKRDAIPVKLPEKNEGLRLVVNNEKC